MEGGDCPYRPSSEPAAAAQSQCLDHATPKSEGIGTNYSEQRLSIQDMDDAQLVGVPLVSSGGPASAAGSDAVIAVSVEMKPAATAIMKLIASGEKRKRGRPPKGQTAAKPPPLKKKKDEEDVCFICFDGGSLVLCDRKGCPKAYHPSCIKRDEAFFRSKAKWNCGWHICSVCRKASHYMCYTCTYSLCKGCTKGADYVCVRGNMGFCTTCMRTIMLIENKDQANKELVQVDFDDKTSWEYLFKVYWIYLKERLLLTPHELTQAKNPFKGLGPVSCYQKLHSSQCAVNDGNGYLPNMHCEQLELKNLRDLEGSSSKELLAIENTSSEHLAAEVSSENSASLDGCKEWASKELLEFVAHMKNGDTSTLSQFDVQELLLEYIKKNNLRDPRKKSQIICDLRLKNLFGKPRVGHIEMLKLLEFHCLIKENSQKNAFIPAGIVGTFASNLESFENNGSSLAMNKSMPRRARKKIEVRPSQNNLDEYAAIDIHNINLIYLPRNLVESLTEHERFQEKVVGSIVRIRISSSDQKQDIYRLVQVVGTIKVPEPYKVGNKRVDVMLEVLNLDKKEAIAIDAISNQEFSEDECRRLCQSIRCGLVKQLTVGEVQRKAIELQAVRLDDLLEAEILKLNHLRDRASEKGWKKEFRECVERLQLLKAPEERQRRLCEVPEVHADPKMNPEYDSQNDQKQAEYVRSIASGFGGSEGRQINSKRKVKDEGPINGQRRINQKRDQIGLSNHGVVRVGQEIPATTLATGSMCPMNDSETEMLWHYHDPSGKIQGPFSLVQLRKWNTAGYFPPDMRIWTVHEKEDSILLTDALNGQFHTAAHLLYSLSLQPQQAACYKISDAGWNQNMDRHGTDNSQIVETSEAGNCSFRVEGRIDGLGFGSCGITDYVTPKEMQPGRLPPCELKRNNSCSDNKRPIHVSFPSDGQGHGSEGSISSPHHEKQASDGDAVIQIVDGRSQENESNSKSHQSLSSGQNWRSFPINLNSNDMDLNSGLSPVTNSDSSEQIGDMNLPELPCPTPKESSREVRVETAEKPQPLSSDIPQYMPTLPSPTPQPIKGNQGGQIAEFKQPPSLEVVGQGSGRSWSSASSLVVGGAQLANIADDWGRYSPTPAKAVIEEWSSGIVSASSLKQPEVAGDHATPTSNIDPLEHTSPTVPTCNVSSWHAVVEPIEFSTLAEESMSDLLAEVDAMESQSGLASPTSAMRCGDEIMKGCKNDCFSIEDLSPTRDPAKNEALSSTGDIQLPCQSTVTEEPVNASEGDAYDPMKRSSRHPSTSSDGETRSADDPVNQAEARSAVQPRLSLTLCPDINDTVMSPDNGMEAVVTTGTGRAPEHMNSVWGAPDHEYTNQGTGWGNPSSNRGASSGRGGLQWDGQRKYGGDRHPGSKDWGFQGGDMGYGKGSRPFWNRQPFAGGGGGYSRPPQRGPRVCKFYESGHCKKGASCGYLHP